MKNRLRQCRNKKNLTLKETSKLLNEKQSLSITPDALAKYERGDREPKLKTWQKLADFFGVTVPYLQGMGQPLKVTEEDLKTMGITENFTKEYSKLFKLFMNMKYSGALYENDLLLESKMQKAKSNKDAEQNFNDYIKEITKIKDKFIEEISSLDDIKEKNSK